jgi:hypothetical protein
MKLTLSAMAACVFLATCSICKSRSAPDLSTLGKLDSINSWYTRLVVKQYKPVYVFQTEAYNKDDIFIRGNVYNYYLIKSASEPSWFEDDFVARSFEYAKSWLKRKGLRYSKIYLQIPVKKEGYSKDIDGLLGKEQQVISTLTKEEFIFDNSIASLVDSKRYDPGFSMGELPKDLVAMIRKRFEEVKGFVPLPYRTKITKSQLIIAEPETQFDASKLFLNNLAGNVKISSVLIRAILVKAIVDEGTIVLDYAGSNFTLSRPVQLVKFSKLHDEEKNTVAALDNIFNTPQHVWEDSREKFARFKKPEVEGAYSDIMKTINSTLDFLFLHEFSHIYLGPNMTNEFRADCYAYHPLKIATPKIDYGIFGELMVTAVQNQGGHYWVNRDDSAKLQEIVNRYARIKKIDSLVNQGKLVPDVPCDQLNF